MSLYVTDTRKNANQGKSSMQQMVQARDSLEKNWQRENDTTAGHQTVTR